VEAIVRRIRTAFADADDTPRRLAVQALLVLGIVVFLVAAGPNLAERGVRFAAVFVVLAAVALIAYDFRLALLFFTAFLFAYEEFDLSSREAFLSQDPDKTILLIRIFGLTLLDFATILLLLPVLVREWRHAMEMGSVRILPFDALFLPLLAVFGIGVVTGAFHTLTPSTFTWDLRTVGQVFAFYFIYSRTFRTKRDVRTLLLIAVWVFALKNGVFLWRWFSGAGLRAGVEYRRVILGSDLTVTSIALTLAVSAFLFVPRLRALRRLALLAASVYLTVLLLSGLGRLTYLLVAIALVMAFVLNRTRIRVWAVAAVFGIGLSGAVLYYNTVLSSENRRVISYALSSAFDWVDALRTYSDMSIGTRALEFVNIWATLDRQDALLFGLGWGSAFREIGVLQPLDGGAGPFEEQLAGVHVHAHVDLAEFLLKLGIVGTIVLYGTFFAIWRRGVRMYRLERNEGTRFVVFALIVTLVIIVPNFVYFLRLHILLGVTLAGLAIFDEANSKERGEDARDVGRYGGG
jgi:O-antigen ligase